MHLLANEKRSALAFFFFVVSLNAVTDSPCSGWAYGTNRGYFHTFLSGKL